MPSAGEAPARFIDRLIVLRMAGGEDDPPARGGERGQIVHFRERRRWRLLEQHMLAGVERLAREVVADVGRRADRDRVELGQRGVGLGAASRRSARPRRARPTG